MAIIGIHSYFALVRRFQGQVLVTIITLLYYQTESVRFSATMIIRIPQTKGIDTVDRIDYLIPEDGINLMDHLRSLASTRVNH